MNDTGKRCVGYGAGTAVLSALIWAGWIRYQPPDVMTILGSVNTQLRTAYAIPPVDKNGVRLSARDDMVADAGRRIEEAAALEPKMAIVEEFRGFWHMLREEPRQAAACYQKARSMEGCDDDMADTLTFNEARMLQKAGDSQAALAVFTTAGDRIQPKWRAQRELECAQLLADLGRKDEAEARLLPLVSSEDPMTTVRAGDLLLKLDRTDAAERAYGAATTSPLGTYRLAVLKLGQGQTDRSMELLERASAMAPDLVKKLVQQDRQTWQGLVTDARIKRLLEPGELTGSSR
jgi:tetratricopeptide (TPR) repeat protein